MQSVTDLRYHPALRRSYWCIDDYRGPEILETKAAAQVAFKSRDDFCDQVRTFFQDVPSTFFQGWTTTGLQSGEGPNHIKQAIKDLQSGTRLSTVKENSALFQDLKKN